MPSDPSPEPRAESDAERLAAARAWALKVAANGMWAEGITPFLLRLIDERDAEIAALNIALNGTIKTQNSQEQELRQQDAELARLRATSDDAGAMEQARKIAQRYIAYDAGHGHDRRKALAADISAAIRAAEVRALERAVQILTEWLPTLTAAGQGHTGAAIIDELRALISETPELKA